jgi:hypothetical protein
MLNGLLSLGYKIIKMLITGGKLVKMIKGMWKSKDNNSKK